MKASESVSKNARLEATGSTASPNCSDSLDYYFFLALASILAIEVWMAHSIGLCFGCLPSSSVLCVIIQQKLLQYRGLTPLPYPLYRIPALDLTPLPYPIARSHFASALRGISKAMLLLFFQGPCHQLRRFAARTT